MSGGGSDVFTRPGPTSIRPAALSDAIIELAAGGGGGSGGGLTPAQIQAMIDASLVAHEGEADPHAVYLTQVEGTALFLPASYTPPPEYATDAEVAAALAPYATSAAVTAALAAHTGAGDPHPTYLTQAEGDGRYTTPTGVDGSITNAITAHEALTNPHPIYLTQAEGDALYTPFGHTSAPDPHPVYLTQTEGDGRYTQGGLTQTAGDARYLQLTGGTLAGDLILSEATPLISLKLVADTQPRSRLTDVGLYFGPGGATALDTGLLRTGANALSLGGSPVLTQTLGDARYATPASVTSAITAHEALADPHPTYTTAAELNAAIATHAGLADPHPVYMTSAEVTTAITAHEALANPHPIYLTQAEADALYLLPATATSTYVPLAGGNVMTGALGPTTTNTRDLGTTALRWRKLWGVDGDLTGALVVTGALTTSDFLYARKGAVFGASGQTGPGFNFAMDTGVWKWFLGLPNAAGANDLVFNDTVNGDRLRINGTTGVITLSGAVTAPTLTVASKAVALSPNANQTLQWLANGFYSDAPAKATYDALVARVATLEGQVATLQAQMGAGTNGHFHAMGTWRQTAKATLPATVLEEAPAA